MRSCWSQDPQNPHLQPLAQGRVWEDGRQAPDERRYVREQQHEPHVRRAGAGCGAQELKVGVGFDFITLLKLS